MELGTIKRSQQKLEDSFAETKPELKTINSKLRNAEEWISDLEDRIMEITQIRTADRKTNEEKWKQL